MRRALFLFVTVWSGQVSLAANADTFRCFGDNPDWTLDFDAEQARFVFPAPTDMDVKLETRAEGQDWPRAYTLIGDRDTAIVLLEHEACGGDLDYRAHVMTQRGETPILLAGCCQRAE